jgi:signal transduction histidine kinase
MRARLVAALVVTSAITLVVAAVALLNPLEKRLGRQEVKSLLATATASRASFEDLPSREVTPGSRVLVRLAAGLDRRSGGRVRIYSSAGRVLADTRRGKWTGAAPTAAPDGRPTGQLVAISNAPDEAHVTLPLEIEGTRYLLELRKPLDNVTAASNDVKQAFTKAGLVGLGTALLVGLGFAAYIARRVRRLRDAALDVAERGPSAPLPEVKGRDEVGDLARSFRQMQERLRELEDARGQFLATASHELRTPVASLQGILELAAQDLARVPPDLGEARAQVDRAEAQARRLGSLAADLLDLTRLDTGLDLRDEPVEIGEVCRAVVAEFELRAAESGRQINLTGSDGPVWASADPSAVARIARILIDNSLRHSPKGTPIQVHARAAGESAELSVRDTGQPVPAEERTLIFDRFERGAGVEAGTGFGLGLAIGRGLARGMGGDLVLDPDVDGVSFVLRLPAAVPAAVPA